jgi:hypothetical protein
MRLLILCFILMSLAGSPNAAGCDTENLSRMQYLALGSEHGWSPEMDRTAAAALLGSLGFTWSEPCMWGIAVRGYLSWRSQYCLLIWGCAGRCGFGSDYRACLLDSCGQPIWSHDVMLHSSPSIARDGTTAFLMDVGDSVRICFYAPSGELIGRWTELHDSLGIEILEYGLLHAFAPNSTDLVILGGEWPRRGQMPKVPSIRIVSSSGRQVWSRGLDCPECDALYLADAPLLIVTYGAAMYSRGENERAYDYKIRVFDIDGRGVARIDGRGKKTLREVIIDSSNRFLYFDVGHIACFDLVTHRLLSPIPEDPLIQLSKSHDPRDSSTARRFLEQHLSSGKHEYDR